MTKTADLLSDNRRCSDELRKRWAVGSGRSQPSSESMQLDCKFRRADDDMKVAADDSFGAFGAKAGVVG